MIAARKRYALDLLPEAAVDVTEAWASTEPIPRQLDLALAALVARPRSGELKSGRLLGWRSWAWDAALGEKGRIVYRVRAGKILVLAIHPDHDEAYRRARLRALRYL